MFIEVQTKLADILALLHQFVQILASLQQIIEVLMADVLNLFELVFQLLEFVDFLGILVLLYEFFKFTPLDVFVLCIRQDLL